MKIETNRIVKKYRDKTVLDLNGQYSRLLFESGKITGIIGSNGSGKTTLMKIMAGLISAIDGEVRYGGHKFDRDIALKITYSNHLPVLFSRSVYENIAYPLRIRKYPEDEIKRVVSGLLEEFEIVDIQNQNAKHLSGGESQKTALARALSFSPEVVFLDEPTASIDPKSVQVIEAALKRRNADVGLTVIIVTHNLAQAFRLCDRLVFLNQGQCLLSDTTEKMRSTQNATIQEFISFNAF